MIAQEMIDQNTIVFPGERRRYPRIEVALQVQVRLQSSDVPLRTQTTDISLGGCYVEMPSTLEVGAMVDLRIWLADQEVHTGGMVVTCHLQFGNGIMFTGMSFEDKNRLSCYLDAIADPPERDRCKRTA
jgi:hypothetical protein